LASILAVSIMLLFWLLLRPGEFYSFATASWAFGTGRDMLFNIAILGVMSVLYNCIPDYFSYMKTRVLLKKIAKSQTVIRVLGFAALDTILAAVIFLIGVIIILWIFGAIDQPPDSPDPPSNLLDPLISLLELHAAEKNTVAGGIFFYAALFVSAWSWLY